MEMTRKKLGEELLTLIELGKQPVEISKMMYKFMNYPTSDIETGHILNRICIIEEGEEFECSINELTVLAKMLINNEDNIEERFEDMVISGDIHAADKDRSIELITKRDLGAQLLDKLVSNASSEEISSWALTMYKKPGMGSEKRLILGRLIAMNLGPEWKCTHGELLTLAHWLTINEEDILNRFLDLIKRRPDNF